MELFDLYTNMYGILLILNHIIIRTRASRLLIPAACGIGVGFCSTSGSIRMPRTPITAHPASPFTPAGQWFDPIFVSIATSNGPHRNKETAVKNNEYWIYARPDLFDLPIGNCKCDGPHSQAENTMRFTIPATSISNVTNEMTFGFVNF